ncbi:MAG TPA: hypothetical protein VFQ85_09240 [Mycobacteriales bacterium]|jgi:hypothetical protein|nr:hypothetical protein [Mycobacteriales bacterium]
MEIAVSGNDWSTIPAESLLERLRLDEKQIYFPNAHVPVADVAAAVREIREGDDLVGRVAMAPSPPAVRCPDGSVLQLDGVIVAGGLRVENVGGITGILLGKPTTADRGQGRVSAPASAIEAWANEQAEIWRPELNMHNAEGDIGVNFLISLKARMDGIHVCYNGDTYMTPEEVREWAAARNEIIAINSFVVHADLKCEPFAFWSREGHVPMRLSSNVLGISSMGRYGDPQVLTDAVGFDATWAPTFGADPAYEKSGEYWWYGHQKEPEAFVLACVAQAWNLDLETMLAQLTHFGGFGGPLCIGIDDNGLDVKAHSYALHWRAVRP